LDLVYLKKNFPGKVSCCDDIVRLMLGSTSVPLALVGSLLLGLVRKAPAHGIILELGCNTSTYVTFCSYLTADFVGSIPTKYRVPRSIINTGSFGIPVDWLHALMELATPAFQQMACLLNSSSSFFLKCRDVDVVLVRGIMRKCPPHWTMKSSESVKNSFRALFSIRKKNNSTVSWMQRMLFGVRDFEQVVLDKEWWNVTRRKVEWPDGPSMRLVCIFLQCLMRINLVHEVYLDPEWSAWSASSELVTFCMDLTVDFLSSLLMWIDVDGSYNESIKRVEGLRSVFEL
jgi:hypothetical protein